MTNKPPSSNKRDTDFSKGKSDREYMNGLLNAALPDGYYCRRIHEHLKVMRVWEKVKNNNLRNRITPSDLYKAMGLDYEFSKTDNRNSIFLRYIMYDRKKGQIYLKLPSEYYIEHWREYLNILSEMNYYVLVCDKERELFSHPVHIDVLIKYWRPKKLESKGNKNRLNFSGPLSKIIFYELNEKDIYGNSVISKLTELL